MDVDGGRRIFNRLGPSSSTDHRNNNTRQHKVCFHWEKGNCSRNPCPFLHPAAANGKRGHQGFGAEDNYRGNGGGLRRTGNYNFTSNSSWGRPQPAIGGRNFVRKVEKKICNYWVQGSCRYGDTCKFLHQWSTDSFTLLTTLEGHKQVRQFMLIKSNAFLDFWLMTCCGVIVFTWPYLHLLILVLLVRARALRCHFYRSHLEIFVCQAVTGITLPSGSDKLYSGSEDETVRVWNCQSGQVVPMCIFCILCLRFPTTFLCVLGAIHNK